MKTWHLLLIAGAALVAFWLYEDAKLAEAQANATTAEWNAIGQLVTIGLGYAGL